MKVTRTGGGARMLFTEVEVETLDGLLADLVELLAPDALSPADPVRERLFPSGYSGTAAAAENQTEFRELTESGLRDERVARAEACRVDLVDPPTRRGRLDIELDATGCDRWLRVLNDLRLTIGTRLDITDDAGPPDIDPSDPQSMSYLVYGWLSAVQDGLVRIAMR
ncbi:DUF2017 family protein [Jatrophihabitans sp.]|uniref:DUF2017 family protein n=1 Tax=Jatrophihabitans sp. TaxID=1932789 RepID=UPI0030C6B705|nr:hypothetical protein [Jatrophihabitans sp.]